MIIIFFEFFFSLLYYIFVIITNISIIFRPKMVDNQYMIQDEEEEADGVEGSMDLTGKKKNIRKYKARKRC